jgi:hypothetical protein
MICIRSLAVGKRLSFGPGPPLLGDRDRYHHVEERWLTTGQAKEFRRGAGSGKRPHHEDQVSVLSFLAHRPLPSAGVDFL